MIDYIPPGSTFTAYMESSVRGLVGVVGVSVVTRPSGVVVSPRTTGNIDEVPADSGMYVAIDIPASNDSGDYWVQWDYPDPDNPAETIYAREELRVTTETAPPVVGGLLPTSAEVADVSPRAVTMGGAELYDFTTQTKPTKERVDRLIVRSYRDVVSKVGTLEQREDLQAEARNAIVYFTTMMIELKYFSEQVGTSRSPYDKFEKLYNAIMRQLIEAVGGQGQTAIDEITGGASELKPQYGFDGFGIGNRVW